MVSQLAFLDGSRAIYDRRIGTGIEHRSESDGKIFSVVIPGDREIHEIGVRIDDDLDGNIIRWIEIYGASSRAISPTSSTASRSAMPSMTRSTFCEGSGHAECSTQSRNFSTRSSQDMGRRGSP